MKLDDLAIRLSALPGAKVGQRLVPSLDYDKRLAEVDALAETYPFLRRDTGFLDFLLRYGGASVWRGPRGAADAFLFIYGFEEFEDDTGADPVSDGYYCFASLSRRFYDAEAEATKVLVNDAPPGVPADHVHDYDRYRHSGRSYQVEASFGFPTNPAEEFGVYVNSYLSERWTGYRWFLGTFLDWLDFAVKRGGLFTPQDLGLNLGERRANVL
jgi:hypothetical protein